MIVPCSCPVPTALHLAFKAQNLHRTSSPPLRVLNQLCLTASQSLNDCGQKLSSEDNLNLVRHMLFSEYCAYHCLYVICELYGVHL